MPASVQLTLLSTILGPDFPRALERQKALGLHYLDLKDGIWGKRIEDLNPEEARGAAQCVQDAGLKVHCFSTGIGHSALETGITEADFRSRHEPSLSNVLAVARELQSQVVRLLPPKLVTQPGELATDRMRREFPWVIPVYRDWADRIAGEGCAAYIENEVNGSLLNSVADISAFFSELNRPAVRLIWDIQNLWQSGTFPTLEVYAALRPWIGAVHLKGGRTGKDGNSLAWASGLEAASWPVREIVRAVVSDGVSPVICLNPSHGRPPEGWDVWATAQHDLAYLRRNFAGME